VPGPSALWRGGEVRTQHGRQRLITLTPLPADPFIATIVTTLRWGEHCAPVCVPPCVPPSPTSCGADQGGEVLVVVGHHLWLVTRPGIAPARRPARTTRGRSARRRPPAASCGRAPKPGGRETPGRASRTRSDPGRCHHARPAAAARSTSAVPDSIQAQRTRQLVAYDRREPRERAELPRALDAEGQMRKLVDLQARGRGEVGDLLRGGAQPPHLRSASSWGCGCSTSACRSMSCVCSARATRSAWCRLARRRRCG